MYTYHIYYILNDIDILNLVLTPEGETKIN